MSISIIILTLLVLLVIGYFVVRGIRLSFISSFIFYFIADLIEYIIPFILIATQAILINFSIIASPWNGFLAIGLVIGAGAMNLLGREQRRQWERKAQEVWPTRWIKWETKKKMSGLFGFIDRYCRYTNGDNSRPGKE